MAQCKKQVGWPPLRFKQLTLDISAVSCEILKMSRMLFVFVVFFTVGTTAGWSCFIRKKILKMKPNIYIKCKDSSLHQMYKNNCCHVHVKSHEGPMESLIQEVRDWLWQKNRRTWKLCKYKLMWVVCRGQKNNPRISYKKQKQSTVWYKVMQVSGKKVI